MADFANAMERIVAGVEKMSRLLNAHERAVVAHHEMGHALVAASLSGIDPVHKVSIIPRGVGAARLHEPAIHRGPVSANNYRPEKSYGCLDGRACR